MSNANSSSQSKKALTSVAIMNMLTKQTGEKFKYKVTRNGGLAFTVEDGSKVIDTGAKVKFTEKAKDLALDYANAKFGVRKQALENEFANVQNEISCRNILSTHITIDREKVLQ